MVTVAQSAELWIVAPAVVGSSPIGHPFFMRIGCCCLWFGFYLLSPGGRPTVLFHKRTSTGSLGSSVQAKCQENVILKAVLVHVVPAAPPPGARETPCHALCIPVSLGCSHNSSTDLSEKRSGNFFCSGISALSGSGFPSITISARSARPARSR